MRGDLDQVSTDDVKVDLARIEVQATNVTLQFEQLKVSFQLRVGQASPIAKHKFDVPRPAIFRY